MASKFCYSMNTMPQHYNKLSRKTQQNRYSHHLIMIMKIKQSSFKKLSALMLLGTVTQARLDYTKYTMIPSTSLPRLRVSTFSS